MPKPPPKDGATLQKHCRNNCFFPAGIVWYQPNRRTSRKNHQDTLQALDFDLGGEFSAYRWEDWGLGAWRLVLREGELGYWAIPDFLIFIL